MPNSGKQDGVDFGYFCEQAKQMKRIANSFPITVAYPNLQIREGPGHPDPELGRWGGGGAGCGLSPTASVWCNNKAAAGGGGGGLN